MGDGGFQQLIIVGMFLLFGLLELVARALKRKGEADVSETIERYEAREQRDADVFEEQPLPQRSRMQPQERVPVDVPRTEPVQAPAPRVTTPRDATPRQATPRAAAPRAATPRVATPRAATVRVAPVRVQSARKASAGMTALDRLDTSGTGRRRNAAPLLNVHDAKRAILAMTVLGPCRAIEPYQDPTASK